MAAAALALLLAEAALRLAGFSSPQLYRWDDLLGASLRPGAQGWWTKEGRAFVRVNSQGLRDREHEFSKPPGVFRVAVLGDSFAEALQVPLEEAFFAVMERSLDACAELGGRRPEVLNFGVSGYGTAQELIMLRHRVWPYAPDLVLLAVTAGNDIRNNTRELEGDPYRPYFVVREGKTVLDGSFIRAIPSPFSLRRALSNLLNRMGDHLRVVQLVREAMNRLPTLLQQEGAPACGDPGLDDRVYREPGDPLWRAAWEVTEGMLGLIAAEVGEGGATLLVATLSSGIQVDPDPVRRRDFLVRTGATDIFYPERRFAEMAGRLGVPFLALAPELAATVERDGFAIHGFGADTGRGHWNRLGHRLAGERLAVEICRLLARDRPAPAHSARSHRPPPPPAVATR